MANRKGMLYGPAAGMILLLAFLAGCGTWDSPGSGFSGGSAGGKDIDGPAALTIVNGLDIAIWYVQISPSSDDNWGPDLLASDEVIMPGASRRISLSGAGLYDIRVRDSDRQPCTYMRQNISGEMRLVVLPSARDSGSAGASGINTREPAAVTVTNGLSVPIWYVYISPSSNDNWGSDLLDSNEMIMPGASRRVVLSGAGLYDVRVRDSGGQPYTYWRQNISGEVRLAILPSAQGE